MLFYRLSSRSNLWGFTCSSPVDSPRGHGHAHYTTFICPHLDAVCGNQPVKVCIPRIYIAPWLQFGLIPPSNINHTNDIPRTRILNSLMKSGSRGGRGAHHGRRNNPPAMPYSQPQPRRGGSNTRTTTRSRSISQSHAPLDVLVASGPPTQSTLPPSPPSNFSVWHGNWIQQVLYVPARTRGEFTPADPVSFSVNGVPGVSLSQALAGECAGLVGAYDRISSFGSSKAIFRIQVGTTTLRTIISPMLSPVCRAPSVRIQGEKCSWRPTFLLPKHLLGKYSTPQCGMGAYHALETREGGWEEGQGLHRGEVPLNHTVQLLRNVTMLRNKDCNTPSPSTRST